MKIFLVGGNGLVGKQIAKKLNQNQHIVKCMNRTLYDEQNVNVIIADLSIQESYLDFLKKWKPDVVIQTAWVTTHGAYRHSLENIEFKNHTIDFAKNCLKYGVKHFIGLGSSAEYGQTNFPCDARITTPNPQDVYGKSKYETYLALKDMYSESNSRFTWGRIFQVYGLGQDPKRLIPWAMNKVISGEEIRLSSPNACLDWITTRDIASCINWVIDNQCAEVIDIGTSIGTTVSQVILMGANLLGVDAAEVKIHSPRSNDMNKLVVSPNSQLFQDGWKPQDNLISGLKWSLNI